jgi:2'-5' RNA ligase
MSDSNQLRLFIAIPLSVEVEEALGAIIADLKTAAPKAPVRWVKPSVIHLTLRFLGDTDPALIPKLNALIDGSVSDTAPSSGVISTLGGFPNLRRPRVIWAGLEQDSAVEAVSKLARQVELAVRKLRYQPEKRSFKPHLTLGRVKSSKGIEPLNAAVEQYRFDPIPVPFDRLVLFQSTLTPKGAIYERLYERIFER